MPCAAAHAQSGPTANVYADAPESSDSSDCSMSRDPPRAGFGHTDEGYADAPESSDASDLFQKGGQLRAQRARTNFVNDLGQFLSARQVTELDRCAANKKSSGLVA